MSGRGWLGLSLRQPWLWAVLAAGKRVENRSWNTWHRGPVILHAAKGCDPDEYEGAAFWMHSRELVRRRSDRLFRESAALPVLAAFDSMQRGRFCGVTEILGVLRYDKEANLDLHLSRESKERLDSTAATFELPAATGGRSTIQLAWHMPQQLGFVLGRVDPCPQVVGRGMPGLFPVSPEIVAQLGLPPTPEAWACAK